MAKGFFYDDEDESNDKPPLHSRPIRAEDYDHESAAGVIPPYSFAHADSFDTRSYVAEIFKKPLFGASQYGGFQDHPVPPADSSRPRSWKLPATNIAPPTMPGADAALDDSGRTILGDETALGRRRAIVGAQDDLPTGNATTTPARELISPVTPPPAAALPLGNDLGFVGKAIDTMAAAIGNAVRAYRAGVIEPVREIPWDAQTSIGNRSYDASFPISTPSPRRPSQQYAEIPGVDSDTRSAHGDDKQNGSQLEAKVPLPLRDLVPSNRTDLQELIADVISTGRIANAQSWKLTDRHTALRDFALRIAEATDPASPLRWRLIEATKIALTPSRSSGVDVEREFVLAALGKQSNQNKSAQKRIGDIAPRNGAAVTATDIAIDPGDRRMPEPSQSSFVLADRFAIEPPASPLAELRRYIGRIHAVAAFKDDGTPLMSDDEVAKFIRQASEHIRPYHRPLLQLTLLAVRTGTIPWWQAQERLREYYAPETSSEALVNGVLDVLPIIGQVRGAIEIGESLEGLRVAVEEGDEVGARKFAGEAALLIAGLVPLLKVGKFANRIPGVEGLKDVLGELAGGRLPFHEFLARWNKGWKLQGHHSFPIFLGGTKKEGIARLSASVRQELHRDLNRFLRTVTDEIGNDMSPRRGNSGKIIRDNFDERPRILAVANFYNGLGDRLRFRNAKREFFRLFPDYRK